MQQKCKTRKKMRSSTDDFESEMIEYIAEKNAINSVQNNLPENRGAYKGDVKR